MRILLINAEQDERLFATSSMNIFCMISSRRATRLIFRRIYMM